MTDFMRFTRLSADSNSCNSLEGILTYADQDVAFIQERNWFYRFFAASTVTPDGDRVIAPADITPPAPGRWIQQGAPGLVGPNPKQPVNLTDCNNNTSGLLRMVDNVSPVEELSLTGVDPAAPLLFANSAVRVTATMPNAVNTNRYYAVLQTSAIQVADSAVFNVRASWSFNAGVSWVDDTISQNYVGPFGAPATALPSPWFLWFASRLRLGSALGDGSMPASTTLNVSFVLECTNGSMQIPENGNDAMVQIFEFGPA